MCQNGYVCLSVWLAGWLAGCSNAPRTAGRERLGLAGCSTAWRQCVAASVCQRVAKVLSRDSWQCKQYVFLRNNAPALSAPPQSSAHGKAEVLKCLVNSLDKISEQCQGEVSRAVRMALWEYKLGAALTGASVAVRRACLCFCLSVCLSAWQLWPGPHRESICQLRRQWLPSVCPADK
jgi:hypothetical protein